MSFLTFRPRALAPFLRTLLVASALLSGARGLAQNSYIYVAPHSVLNTHGGTLKVAWTDRLRYSKGEAGGSGTTSLKGGSLPSHIQRQADGLFRTLDVKQGLTGWGDDLRTFVVLRVSLAPLVGDSNAGVLAPGWVTQGETIDGGDTLENRIAMAIEHAARNLAMAMKQVGVTEEMWEVLTAAGEKEWGVGGVPFDVRITDDSSAGHERAWQVAQKLLSERQKLVRDARFMREKIAGEAKRRGARIGTLLGQKSAPGDGSTIGVYAEGDYQLPIAWYWRAWNRIDRNDYGPETVALVERAERALKFWENRTARAMPLLVTARQFEHFGGMTWDGDSTIEAHLRLNRAYIHYLRGIVDENRAAATTDLELKSRLKNSAAVAFENWAQAYENSPDDVIQARAAGIAAARGIRGFSYRPADAIDRFEWAAKNGVADCYNWLGIVHDYYGAPKLDRAKAKEAYERGLAQGSVFAQQNLAVLLLFGAPGVPQNFERYNSLRLANGQNRPNISWHTALLPTDNAPERNGNKLAARVLGDAMPRVLAPHRSSDPIEGRDARIEVDYTVASGVGQLVLDFSDAIIAGRSDMALVHSKPIRVEGSGRETLWLGGATNGYLVGRVKIRLLDDSGKNELTAASLPFALRWDPGTAPVPAATPSSGTKLTKDEINALDAEFKRGIALAEKEDYAGAEKIYDALLGRIPDSGPVRVERAAVRWNLHKDAEALADIEEAIRLKTPGFPAHRLRGIMRTEKGDLPGALADFTEALRRDPKNAELIGFRGAVQFDLGKLELALADFNAALELDPKLGQVLFQRARLHEARSDASAALSDYSRVLQLDSKATGALVGRGRIRFNQQRWEAALTDLRQALELEPGFAEAARQLGYALLGSGDYAAAVEALGKAADLSQAQGADTYPLLLRHIAVRRLGREDPRLATSWGRWEKDPWAQALGKFLVGRATEEELEQLVATTPDPELAKGRRCEMNYYIGCVRLLAGDRSTARLRFQAAVATEARDFIEYVLAQTDLKRL